VWLGLAGARFDGPVFGLEDWMRSRLTKWAGLCGALSVCAGLGAQPVPFTSQTIDANNSGDCKAIADLDLDGKADPILGGSSLCWYESGASFSKRVIRSQVVYVEFTTDVQAADLDADGDFDIVIGDGAGPGNVLWFENPRLNALTGAKGDPRIGAAWMLRVIGTHIGTVHDLEVADLDNDGRLEVVASGHGCTQIWKRGTGQSWTVKDISSLAGDGVFLGDIDRDGYTDVATPRAWLRNPGDPINGTWARFTINSTSGEECALADLDGDGRLDLLTCDPHNRAAFAWFQQPAVPTSSSWTRRVIDNSMGAHHPEVADFNHDNLPDILMGLELEEVAVYLNMGGSPPSFQKQQVAAGGGYNARRGDMNGDGLPDILACDYIGHPPVKVYLNTMVIAPCYANCDGSSGSPLLTPNDFQCFISRFVAGDAYANCDGSPGAPPLTGNDFQCFLSLYFAGCT